MICASAIGIYNQTSIESLNETASKGSDWIARMVCDWEDSSNRFKKIGARVVQMRISLILDKNAGFLKYNLLSMRYGLGLILGDKNRKIKSNLNAIVSRKKSLCKRLLLCLKCLLNINSEFHFNTVIDCLMCIFASIGFFTVIYICLITIFCLKNERKTLCFECNIIAILLSILFVVLAINYLKKIEKEKKIDSDCLSNFICFVVFFSFSTLVTFVEDCSRDNWIYLLSPIFGFCTCFCCVKYNQKIN